MANPVWTQISTTINHMLLNGRSWTNSTGCGLTTPLVIDEAAETGTEDPVDQVGVEHQETGGEAGHRAAPSRRCPA